MRHGRQSTRLVVAVACAAALALPLGRSVVSDARPPTTGAAGQDSRSPRTGPPRAKLRAVRLQLARLERQVALMEQSTERYEDWQTCLKYIPVNEQGDRDRQMGYLYDERDGTGPGYMDGLAVDRRRRRGREDYMFINFRGGGCQSDPPQPGGTAEPAASRRVGLRRQVMMLERRTKRLSARSQRLDTISARFDEWESCVSWVPVTEMGDPDRKFGYLYGPNGSVAGYRAGLHVDRADWDDPDYMFLALVGGDRPGRRCQDEPGEGVD
jgi:hypothetical protein